MVLAETNAYARGCVTLPLLAWFLSPIGRYFAIALGAVVILGGLYLSFRNAIRGDVQAEIIQESLGRITDAIRAGDAVSTDPGSVLTNDGHCRDCR